ncbi:MAG: hypothetical protein J7497_13490, partial [Chitinophagaceae bacterium]|nr:hypothetical protein [Chitinophagaceae bacterium]
MIRCFLLCTLLLFIVSTNAQQKPFEWPVGWWGGAAVLNTFAASDPHHFAIALSKKDSVKVLLINSDHELVAQFNVKKSSSEKFTGGFIRQDTIAIYYAGKDNIHSWVYHIPSATIKDYIIPFDTKKEKELGKLSCGNRFIHITTRKKSPVIITYDITAHGTIERSEYDLGEKAKLKNDDLWNELSRSSALSRDPDVAVMNSFELNQPEAAANPSKIYY